MKIGKFRPAGAEFLAVLCDGKDAKFDGVPAGNFVVVEEAAKGEYVPVKVIPPEEFRPMYEGVDEPGKEILSR